jgi:hypothetical protein
VLISKVQQKSVKHKRELKFEGASRTKRRRKTLLRGIDLRMNGKPVAAFLGLIGGLLCASVSAASSVTGKVAEVHVRTSDGLHWVIMAVPPQGRPACATTFPYYMIKDEHSDAGKAQFAMILSAYMAGKTITVSGEGACTRWYDGEDIGHVSLAE